MIKEARKLELLAPAANPEVAIEAIRHGADAVYIGASSHGARKAASNSLDGIAEVVDFAHRYRARVYVTVNTIIFENELRKVETLCRDLYHIGVDALIVQDMAVLRMSIPPIALHASTQCDIRTPEKARFLQEAGFSQLVLARELTLSEIKDITGAVDIPVECFIHGALCVSYSGRCHASCAATGRSANRGECAQICRLPFNLTDAGGKVISHGRHLLSLHDFNASGSLPDLVDAGVSSFKIEGRLKEADYVKNITAFYSRQLDSIAGASGGRLVRSSFGNVCLRFDPVPEKSFNRGFTDYFLNSRRPMSIASMLTPKSMGETITDIRMLHNGDGISFFDRKGNYCGVNVNRVDNGRIMTGRNIDIPKDAVLHRTSDIQWQRIMSRNTAERRISLSIELDDKGVTARDERGGMVRLPLDVSKSEARSPMDFSSDFSRMGNTEYETIKYDSTIDPSVFIPRSEIAAVRRRLVDELRKANLATYRFDMRRSENMDVPYPQTSLDFRDNVANSLAMRFYKDHGVENIEPAMETRKHPVGKGTVVMTTRHCVLRELGMCLKKRGTHIMQPLSLDNGQLRYRLRFDCAKCEMQVLTDGLSGRRDR